MQASVAQETNAPTPGAETSGVAQEAFLAYEQTSYPAWRSPRMTRLFSGWHGSRGSPWVKAAAALVSKQLRPWCHNSCGPGVKAAAALGSKQLRPWCHKL